MRGGLPQNRVGKANTLHLRGTTGHGRPGITTIQPRAGTATRERPKSNLQHARDCSPGLAKSLCPSLSARVSYKSAISRAYPGKDPLDYRQHEFVCLNDTTLMVLSRLQIKTDLTPPATVTERHVQPEKLFFALQAAVKPHQKACIPPIFYIRVIAGKHCCPVRTYYRTSRAST